MSSFRKQYLTLALLSDLKYATNEIFLYNITNGLLNIFINQFTFNLLLAQGHFYNALASDLACFPAWGTLPVTAWALDQWKGDTGTLVLQKAAVIIWSKLNFTTSEGLSWNIWSKRPDVIMFLYNCVKKLKVASVLHCSSWFYFQKCYFCCSQKFKTKPLISATISDQKRTSTFKIASCDYL